MKLLYIYIVTVFLLASCQPTQKVEDAPKVIEENVKTASSTCNTFGKVMKASLDGCSYLIYLEDGKKLEPVVIEDKSFKLEAGQRIHFSYEMEQDVMSICMAAPTVRITCIELRKKGNTNN